jgi:hypothetical protein
MTPASRNWKQAVAEKQEEIAKSSKKVAAAGSPRTASTLEVSSSKKVAAASSPRSASIVELSWPSERLETKNLSKQGSTHYSSSQEGVNTAPTQNTTKTFSTGSHGSIGARLNTIRTKSPRTFRSSSPLFFSGGNAELKRNLEAASVVMDEERNSSIGSGSTSTRSSLSHQELGSIAERALRLSKVHEETRVMRRQNIPLHTMWAEKRERKVEGNGTHLSSQPFPQNKSNLSFSYGSAARLSDKLSRAENSSFIKQRYNERLGKSPKADTSLVSGLTGQLTAEVMAQNPVFAAKMLAQRSPKAKVADKKYDSFLDNGPSSPVRASRVSDGVRKKADHHAAKSPTRRKMPSSVDDNFPQWPRSSSPGVRMTQEQYAGYNRVFNQSVDRAPNESSARSSSAPRSRQAESMKKTEHEQTRSMAKKD